MILSTSSRIDIAQKKYFCISAMCIISDVIDRDQDRVSHITYTKT